MTRRRDGRDRRVRQHRHRPDVQAAPLRRDRAALHGRRRPGERGPRAAPASSASRRSPRASTGCSPQADLPDIVFEATSAYVHVRNAPRYRDAGIRAIDLTPGGDRAVRRSRRSTSTEHLDEMNVNMVTCGGQATIPMVHAVSRVVDVAVRRDRRHGRVAVGRPGHPRQHRRVHPHDVAAPSRCSAAPRAGKAIIILNPAEPPLIMRDTIFCQIPDDADHDAIAASIDDVVADVQQYVPGYRLRQRPAVRSGHARRHRTGSRSSSRSRAPATTCRRTPATSTS